MFCVALRSDLPCAQCHDGKRKIAVGRPFTAEDFSVFMAVGRRACYYGWVLLVTEPHLARL